ncbi:DinB family protein [Chitinophaga defluvii]|uniref:DinB family protein n=1 Tax=Chitinophaga defluvii TaxID=3163343 RepID=A0ABV2T2X9_9BACT
MTLTNILLKEMAQEAQTTRKMLERVPDDKYDWQPHPKSMSIKQLATHIAELPSWVQMALTTEGLDFAENPYDSRPVTNTKDLLAFFEQSLAAGRAELEKATDEQLEGTWVLRNGDQIYSTSSKGEVIRMAYCQIVHHRAQLGVFLRLLDVPIPGSYGPSADDDSF